MFFIAQAVFLNSRTPCINFGIPSMQLRSIPAIGGWAVRASTEQMPVSPHAASKARNIASLPAIYAAVCGGVIV